MRLGPVPSRRSARCWPAIGLRRSRWPNGLLGYGPEAEDAVRAVVRNACRRRPRTPETASLDAAVGFAESLSSDGPDAAELLERHALRDWVWTAVEPLPAPRLEDAREAFRAAGDRASGAIEVVPHPPSGRPIRRSR